MMDRLKRFLSEKKVEKSFKKAGAGHRLTDDTSKVPSTVAGGSKKQDIREADLSAGRIASADFAAHAAFKRMNVGAKQETAAQRSIRMQAMKELEKEKRQLEMPPANKEQDLHSSEYRRGSSVEHSNMVQDVFFTCPVFDEDIKMTKSEAKETVEAYLRSRLGDDAVVASSLMIFTLNDPEKRSVASETLQKCIKNIIEKPEEPKYRRIRINNKAMQDRVLSAKGGHEFLVACGFEERIEKTTDGASSETVLVISDAKAADAAALGQALNILETGEPLPLKLHRNPKVFFLEQGKKISDPKLSSDFFAHTSAEIKKEQDAKTAEVEKMLSLRTREMRERDEMGQSCKYKYTLLRIKFPNSFVLQGTFGVHEEFGAVREFVYPYLEEVELPLFVLKDPVSGKEFEDHKKTLGELKLVPAAVINFEWDPEVQSQFQHGPPTQVPYLRQTYVVKAEKYGS